MSTMDLDQGNSAPRQKRRNASGEFWIKPGIYVQQRSGKGPIMTVLRILREGRIVAGQRKLFIKGVECRWVNTYGDVCHDTFHTKELVPWES